MILSIMAISFSEFFKKEKLRVYNSLTATE